MKEFFVTVYWFYGAKPPNRLGGEIDTDYTIEAESKEEVRAKLEKQLVRLQELSPRYQVRLGSIFYNKEPSDNNGVGVFKL